jgi:hypothetical protein
MQTADVDEDLSLRGMPEEEAGAASRLAAVKAGGR